jgi:transcriptional regulator with XRE-family HTH domain
MGTRPWCSGNTGPFQGPIASSTLAGRFQTPSGLSVVLSVMKTEEQRRARELRAEGCSVKEIERRLHVARSSVSRWVKDIQLGDEQRRALAARVTEGRLQAAERKARAARLLRAEYQKEGRRLSRERGVSYATGCMLYWAEGEKSRCRLSVSNSDVDLLRFFCRVRARSLRCSRRQDAHSLSPFRRSS